MTDADYRQAAIYIAVKKRNVLTCGELSSIKCLVCRQKNDTYIYIGGIWLCPQELTTLPHELHPNDKCVIEELGLYYVNTVWTHKLWTGEKISGENHSINEFPTMKPLD